MYCKFSFNQLNDSGNKKKISKLVKSDDVYRLNIILKLFNSLLYQICRYFFIFHRGPDYYLEDAIGNRFFLPFSLPKQAVHLDAQYFVSQSVQVGILTPRFDLPNDETLCNWCRLLILLLRFLTFLFQSNCSCYVSLSVICKWIKIVVSISSLQSLFSFFFFRLRIVTSSFLSLLVLTSLITPTDILIVYNGCSRCLSLQPALADLRFELARNCIPSIAVWLSQW